MPRNAIKEMECFGNIRRRIEAGDKLTIPDVNNICKSYDITDERVKRKYYSFLRFQK
jgi:hypothetical protein